MKYSAQDWSCWFLLYINFAKDIYLSLKSFYGKPTLIILTMLHPPNLVGKLQQIKDFPRQMLRVPSYLCRLGRLRLPTSKLLFSQQSKPPPKQQAKPPTGLSRQQMQKAHDQLTRQMLSNQDAHSFQKEGFGRPHMIAGGLFVIAIGLGLGYYQSKLSEKKQSVQQNEAGGIKNKQRLNYGIGGPWELVDCKGKTLTHKDLRGSYYVMYFGFAKCPDVCPNFLTRMSKAMKLLRNNPQSQFFNLKVIFVELDPDRDSPQDVENFLAMFDKRIIGVSGVKNDDPRLVEAMKQFKIYANKIYRKKEDEGTKNYMIDHTALGFLMDHNNELVMIIGPNLNGEQIAKGIFDDAIETNNLETHTIKDAH